MTDQQLEFRSARQVGVNFAKRIVELIVTPWDEEALVPHQGRMIRELFVRGAYDGIERRANRIRANRDHDVTRTVGRAVALHPSRQEGLVAEIRIAQTDLGDETLTLADEECLDASAGFLPLPGGEQWEGRSLRRITKAWLAHIAMTPDPAYEGATVLAVRNNAPGNAENLGTPNLDVIRAWRLQKQYASLDH